MQNINVEIKRKEIEVTITKGGLTVGEIQESFYTKTQIQELLLDKEDLYALATNVKRYGAVGDGVADDTNAISEALAENNLIKLTDGVYKCSFIDQIISGKKYIIAEGNVRIIQTHANGVFRFKGTWDYLGTATIAEVTANLQDAGEPNNATVVNRLTVPTNQTMVKGDVLKVVCDDIIEGMDSTGGGFDYRRGEYSMAGLSTSNSQLITLTNLLVQTYTTNVRVARLHDNSVVIKGITFDVLPSLSIDNIYSASVTLRALKGCIVEDCDFINQKGSRGIFEASFNTKIHNCNFHNLENRPAVSHYGYGVDYCGWGLQMTNCHGTQLRHMFSANSNTVEALSMDFELYGGGSCAVIANSVCEFVQSAGFDTHEMNYGIEFVNCLVYGAFQGSTSGGNGFTMRGKKMSMVGCKAINCKTGFSVATLEDGFIEDCKALGCHLSGLTIAIPARHGAVTTQKRIYIRNSVFEGGLKAGNESLASTVVEMGADNFTADVEITNCTFRLLGSSTQGGRVFNIRWTNLKMRNCVIDVQDFTSYQFVNAFLVRDNNCVIDAENIDIVGKASLIGNRMTLWQGNSAGNTSPIRAKNFKYQHNSASPTIIGSNLTAIKYSYVVEVNGVKTVSNYVAVTPTAGLVLPIANILDDIINVRFFSQASLLAIAALPALDHAGQVINFRNEGVYSVTCPNPNTIIPATKGMATYFDGANHKMFVQTGNTIEPSFGLTLVNGVNANIDPNNRSISRVAGPTGAFQINGIRGDLPDGFKYTIWNTTNQAMTIKHEDTVNVASNPERRIDTNNNGADIVLPAQKSYVTLFYDKQSTNNRWVVIGHS